MHDDPVRSGTTPPHPEPDYRFTLANERTFLAWQRTSLGLLAAALAALHFLPESGHDTSSYALGGLLAVLAALTAGSGLYRWRCNDRAIRHGAALPEPRVPIVLAAALVGIGALTVTAAVATVL